MNDIIIPPNNALIDELKIKLANTDFMVIKNAEALTLGLPLPYSPQEVHDLRQSWRDRINELETEMQNQEQV